MLVNVACNDMPHGLVAQACRVAEQHKSYVAATWQPAGLCHLQYTSSPVSCLVLLMIERTDCVHAGEVTRAFIQGG